MDYAKVRFTEEDLGLLESPEKELVHKIGALYLATGDITHSNRISLTKEISPGSLYLYLLGRYDSPNGILSMLGQRDEAVRRSVLWHYTLGWRKRHLHIICHPYRVDVIFGPGPEVEITSSEFAVMLKSAFGRHRVQIDKAKELVEKHKAFLNPLSHILDSIRQMLDRAELLKGTLEEKRKHPETWEEIKWHIDNHESQSAAAFELSSCCLSVRMMAPVAAEMFLNLVIFNLFKTEGQAKEAKEKLRKSPIREKLEALSDRCDGFAIRPDMKSDPIKGFLDLYNHRNHILHGNISTDQEEQDEFLVHRGVATIMKFKSIFDRSIRPTMNAFPLEEARNDQNTALAFMNYLLACMEPGKREIFIPMLKSVDLHYGMRSKQLRALFDNDFHESIDPDLLEGSGPLPDWLA